MKKVFIDSKMRTMVIIVHWTRLSGERYTPCYWSLTRPSC